MLNRIKYKIIYFFRLLFKPKLIKIDNVFVNTNFDSINDDMRNILYSEKYEVAERKLLPKVLSKDDIVLEVGTGIGFLSTLCAKVIQKPNSVYTFEANPLLKDQIEATFALNEVDVNYENAVLGDDDKEIDFYVSDKFYSSSIIDFDKNAKKIKVPQKNVNSIIEKIDPTFLIVDIEGFEIEFFKYFESFGNIKNILLEIHPKKVDIEELNKMFFGLYSKGFYIDFTNLDKDIFLLKRKNDK